MCMSDAFCLHLMKKVHNIVYELGETKNAHQAHVFYGVTRKMWKSCVKSEEKSCTCGD